MAKTAKRNGTYEAQEAKRKKERIPWYRKAGNAMREALTLVPDGYEDDFDDGLDVPEPELEDEPASDNFADQLFEKWTNSKVAQTEAKAAKVEISPEPVAKAEEPEAKLESPVESKAEKPEAGSAHNEPEFLKRAREAKRKEAEDELAAARDAFVEASMKLRALTEGAEEEPVKEEQRAFDRACNNLKALAEQEPPKESADDEEAKTDETSKTSEADGFSADAQNEAPQIEVADFVRRPRGESVELSDAEKEALLATLTEKFAEMKRKKDQEDFDSPETKASTPEPEPEPAPESEAKSESEPASEPEAKPEQEVKPEPEDKLATKEPSIQIEAVKTLDGEPVPMTVRSAVVKVPRVSLRTVGTPRRDESGRLYWEYSLRIWSE